MGLPRKEDNELAAFFKEDKKALSVLALIEYWTDLKNGALFRGRDGSSSDEGSEFRVGSCVPWAKISAVLVSDRKDTRATNAKVLSLVKMLPLQSQKPIFDMQGNPVYLPN